MIPVSNYLCKIPRNHVGQTLEFCHTFKEPKILHQTKSEGALQISMFNEIDSGWNC